MPKKILSLVFFLLPIFGLAQTRAKDSLKYVDCSKLAVVGRYHAENNYHRLPQRYEKLVRPAVWELAVQSTGIGIRFRSNASTMYIKWTLLTGDKFPHMALTGIAGLDLYTLQDGEWRFIQTARPRDTTSQYLMFENKNAEEREYLLNLPLYDGVKSVFIGVNPAASVNLPKASNLLNKKPVVYYGSSIAQGASATRPGMAFTNLLSRWMNRAFINLGFSGEGTYDEPIGQAMCDVDAALYVVDCNPNSELSYITERAVKLVKQLKKCRPQVPVLLVENFIYTDDATMPENTMLERGADGYLTHKKWRALLSAFEQLKQEGITGVYYHRGYDLIGHDSEGTVDGSHPNDLGMYRIAQDLLPHLNKLLHNRK